MEQKEDGFNIEDEEVFFEHTNSSPEDEEFDAIVTALEEILQDDAFQAQLNSFYQSNCDLFEESKENKLEYTDVFTAYTNMVETALEQFLSSRIPGFTMKKFEQIVVEKRDVLSGETFDLLCSLGDFMEFKDVMVAQKNMKGASASVKASRGTGGSGLDLSISGHHL